MAIVPDSKDWTWVLDRPCPECGLDARVIRPESVATMIRANAEAWAEVLATSPDPRRRPRQQVWSALEYACHVRDVLRIYDHRLGLMLTEVDPLYPNWDQDATAIEHGYAEQDPVAVSAALQQAAADLAEHFDQVGDAEWLRTGRRSDGAHFTIASFSRYFIHDPVHHLHDVTGDRSPTG